MSREMNERAHATYVSPNAVQDILIRLWDPLEVGVDRKEAYERFIAPLVRMCNDGASIDDIEAKLHVFEQTLLNETLAEHRRRVAAALVTLRAGH